MTALALALALLAPPKAPKAVRVPTPPPREPGAPVHLQSEEDARRLCGALVFPERAARAERPEERSRTEAAQGSRRAEALGRRYQVEVEGRGLAFDYEEENRRLTLTERALLLGAGGSLRVWATEDPDLPVPADPARARRIAAAARNGELTLRLVFALPEDEEVAVCSHLPGTKQWSLGVEPVAWAYLAGGAELARAGDWMEQPSGTASGRPRVRVGDPTAGGEPARKALEARLADLRSCQAQALARRPGLEGSLVLELDLPAAGGSPREARVAMDSIHDDALARCALEVARKARFPAGGLVAVPVHFELLE